MEKTKPAKSPKQPQVVAAITGIIFHTGSSQNKDYIEKARNVTFQGKAGWKTFEGVFQACIGTYDECHENLRKQVKEYLTVRQFKPSDFSFSFNYTEIKGNNFWLIPCSSRCQSYLVEPALD